VEVLKAVFLPFGKIKDISMPTDYETGAFSCWLLLGWCWMCWGGGVGIVAARSCPSVVAGVHVGPSRVLYARLRAHVPCTSLCCGCCGAARYIPSTDFVLNLVWCTESHKGFAFVDFESAEDAAAAIDNMVRSFAAPHVQALPSPPPPPRRPGPNLRVVFPMSCLSRFVPVDEDMSERMI
jgi:RNA recognition motif-containing protein